MAQTGSASEMNDLLFSRRLPRVVFTYGKGLFNQTGGSQKSICEVASLFARDGYPTTIIFDEADVSRYDLPRFDLDSRVRLINIARWAEGDGSAIADPDASEWADSIDGAQPDLVIIWFVARKSILAVHEHLRSRGIPFICAHRMDPAHDFLGRPGKGDEAEKARQILKGAAAHAVQTPDYVDFFPTIMRERVWIIPNIVPLPSRSPALRLDGERKVILNVGRLHPQKNQALLIRAFACVAHLYPDWDVHIYGDGPGRRALKALIELHGMEGRIRLKGERSDLDAVYRAATLFAFPSVFEGFSRAHSEAMSYGLPSIGLNDCASSRRLIGESGSGRLADNSALSFARELTALMAQPQKLDRLGRRATDHVARFGEKAVFVKWKHLVAAVAPDLTARLPAASSITPQRASVASDLVARPFHVAFAIGAFKSYVGGAEKSLAEIASYLSQSGYVVTIIMSEENAAQSAATFYPVHDSVRLRNLHPWLEEGSTAPAKGRKEWLEDRARQIVREVNPDILICFTMEKSLLYHEAVRGTDIPYVIAHRNDPSEKLATLVSKAKDKPGYMTAVFQSWDRAAAQTVQLEPYRAFFPRDVQSRIVTIPNVIQPAVGIDSGSEDAATVEGGVILNVGRLHPQKNQQLLIRAFAELAGEFPSWQVHIYGEGPERDYLQELIDHLGMTQRIRLQGATQAMEPVYRGASVFAFPSVFEGFSRAHGEAMAYGLPSLGLKQCVSSRVLIEESGAGTLVENTVESFTDGLRKLMEDRALRLQCRTRALDYVQRFAPERVYVQWRILIDSLARNHAPFQTAEIPSRPLYSL